VRGKKGSFLAWRSKHWPLHDAWMRGDYDRFRELRQQELAREEMYRERFVYCIICRALLIHSALGFYYCPYQNAGVHEHARRALR
jgi:hypothetical protein